MIELKESLGNFAVRMLEPRDRLETPHSLNPDIELTPAQREVKGMLEAIDLVHQKATDSTKPGFDGTDLLAINKLVMNDPFNPHLYGALRKATVKIGSTIQGKYREASFTPVTGDELPKLFGEFSVRLKEETGRVNNSMGTGEIIGIAAWAHTELIRLHPFIDGNGRTARLLADFIFKRANLPYITNWGAKGDEYKEVVDRTFRENDEGIFKRFLARKLILRSREVGKVEPILKGDMATVKSDMMTLLNSLGPNAS